MDLRHALSPTNIALVAVFAGLLAASTIWPGVPFAGGVPITLQTLAVLIAGAVLGPWRGAAAVGLYLIVGTAGAPIFAERTGGPGVWGGATAGFLASFVVAAFVAGWIVRAARRAGRLNVWWTLLGTAVAGLVVINLIGWPYLGFWYEMTPRDTLVAALPFQIGDSIKVVLAAVIAWAVHRAYPGLLGPARPAAASSGPPAASAETPATSEVA